jgi:carbonic anhydrase/acetyltransferase-like protein (isoleucine patch superfamily)
MIHCSGGKLDAPTKIGNRVHIGVGATIHGATVEDECRIGDLATVLDHAVIKKHSIIAPGAVVSPKTVVPSGQLWSGIPAKFERELTIDELSQIGYALSDTADLAYVHAEEQAKNWEQIVDEAADLEENNNRNAHYCQVTPEKVCDILREYLFTGYRFENNIKMKLLRVTQFLVVCSTPIVSSSNPSVFSCSLKFLVAPSGEEKRGGFYESDEADRAEVLKNFGLEDKYAKENGK